MSLDIQTLRLKLFLQEELTDKQKKQVDKWPESKRKNRNIDFSDHFFGGKDVMRRSFDLQTPEKISKHAKLIAKHFENHPHIRITDYGRGEASETVQTQMGPKERPISIAKALSKTGADHLVPGFANDPTRTSASKNLHKDYQVTITRHPHDIAGMTSKGQSWEHESCMNYENGSNNDYLPEDVREGTHVAYLHRKDDPEIKKPLARIALKPFHNVEDDEDTIIRPEGHTYGSGGAHFNHTVHSILDKHFQGVPASVYNKNQHVYDDSGDDTYFAATKKEHLEAGINKILATKKSKGFSEQRNLSSISDAIVSHPKFDHKMAEHIIDQIEPTFDLSKKGFATTHEGKEYLLSDLTKSRNNAKVLNKISDKHFEKLINLPYLSNRENYATNHSSDLLISQRGMRTHSHLLFDKLAKDAPVDYNRAVSRMEQGGFLKKNPNVTQKLIDHWTANKSEILKRSKDKDFNNDMHSGIMQRLIGALPKEKITTAHLDTFFDTPHKQAPSPATTARLLKVPGVKGLLTDKHKNDIERSKKAYGEIWFND